jgi:hypothetical protein
MSAPHSQSPRTPIYPHHRSPFAYLAVTSLIICTCLALLPAAVLAVVWVLVRNIMMAV